MGALVVDQGLQRIADLAGGILSGSTNVIQSMTLDDSATALVAGTTTLGSPLNFLAKAFDAGFPTRTSNVLKFQSTYATTDLASVTIKRVIVHHVAAGSVTGTSASVNGGVDGQSILHGSFTLIVELDYTFASP